MAFFGLLRWLLFILILRNMRVLRGDKQKVVFKLGEKILPFHFCNLKTVKSCICMQRYLLGSHKIIFKISLAVNRK